MNTYQHICAVAVRDIHPILDRDNFIGHIALTGHVDLDAGIGLQLGLAILSDLERQILFLILHTIVSIRSSGIQPCALRLDRTMAGIEHHNRICSGTLNGGRHGLIHRLCAHGVACICVRCGIAQSLLHGIRELGVSAIVDRSHIKNHVRLCADIRFLCIGYDHGIRFRVSLRIHTIDRRYTDIRKAGLGLRSIHTITDGLQRICTGLLRSAVNAEQRRTLCQFGRLIVGGFAGRFVAHSQHCPVRRVCRIQSDQDLLVIRRCDRRLIDDDIAHSRTFLCRWSSCFISNRLRL